MARSLTGDAITQKNANSAKPINLLVIELTGGTVYYSDRDMTVDAQPYVGKVLTWGSLDYAAQEDGHASTVLRGLALADPDKSLLASLEANQWQRITTKVYQWWSGLADADKVLLLEGVLTGPLTWSENERSVSFDVIDVAREWDRPVGTLATRRVCPDVAPEDEGRMIPICYGEGIKKVKAIAAKVGRKGRLLRDCTDDATTLYIEGWEDVAPGTEITIRIGDEIIKGDIDGVELSNASRGEVVATGRTSAEQSATENESTLVDIGGFDGQYVGMWLKINVPNTPLPGGALVAGWSNTLVNPTTEQHKRIVAFDSGTGRITWEGGAYFQIGGDGETTFFGPIGFAIGLVWRIPEGKQVSIVSLAAAHSAGEEVVEHQAGGILYIIADHAIQRIRGVWVKGASSYTPLANEKGQQSDAIVALANSSMPAAQQNTPAKSATGTTKETWRKLSTLDYSVNLNTGAAFPGIGHNVALIKLQAPPTYNRKLGAVSDEIWVDMDGAYADGSLVQHPLDVIDHLMDDRFGLSASVHSSISGGTVADKTRHLRCRLALTEQKPLVEVCAHLAFIAHCRLYVTDDAKMAAQYLTHWGDSTAVAVGDTKIALDSPVLGWREYEELVTRVRFSFQEHGFVRWEDLDDTVIQATYGVRQREIDLSWLADEDMADWVAERWLARWKRVNQTADVATGLHTQELVVGDQIDLSRSGILDTSPAQIEAVTQRFGDGARAVPDMIRHFVRLPLWPGCATSCEAECQTGCESQCEVHCQLTCQTGCEESCQTACQDVCEMACETALEIICATGCMASCTWGCEIQCTGSNMQEAFSCVDDCETTCMATCEICSMPRGCETCCEVACQDTCECGCETIGEPSYPYPPGPCESVCQCISEDCDVTCQIGGQDAGAILCETQCELDCEAAACESQEACGTCCVAVCTVVSGECV